MKRSEESLAALETYRVATSGAGLALQRFEARWYRPSSLEACSGDELLLIWAELKVAQTRFQAALPALYEAIGALNGRERDVSV